MKITFVEMAGFRGFKGRVRLDFPAGFAVLTGRNGTGKSTVLDAIDFALTGTINKFAVREAKGGGLDQHIWWVGPSAPERQYVSVGFADDGSEEWVVTRSRERGLEMPLDSIAQRLCAAEVLAENWNEVLMRTTLIRDETIAALSLDLPEQGRASAVRAALGSLTSGDYSKRTSAIASAANAMHEDLKRRLDATQGELGRALSALTEARSAAEKQPDLAEAERTIARLAPNLEGTADRLQALRRIIVGIKMSAQQILTVMARAEKLAAEEKRLGSPGYREDETAAHNALELALAAHDRAKSAFVAAQASEEGLREIDALSDHMASLLASGEAIGLQDGHCPLCAAGRTRAEFAEAIAAARDRLSEAGKRAAAVRSSVAAASLELRNAESRVESARSHARGFEERREGLERERNAIHALLEQSDANVEIEPEVLRRLALQRQEAAASLEFALVTLESSAAHSRVAEVEARVTRLREQLEQDHAQLAVAQRAMSTAGQIDHAARELPNQLMTEQFDTVMPLVKELYRRLRPHTDWREIEIDFGGRVRASLNFIVGDGRNPQFLFSSGQRRATGLAFLLAIHLSRPWSRLKTVLLDDPVQHIDDYRALNLVEVLSAIRQTGRQVIVAVEDPALADVLCRRLRSTVSEPGTRFELATGEDGAAVIQGQLDVPPLPRQVFGAAIA